MPSMPGLPAHLHSPSSFDSVSVSHPVKSVHLVAGVFVRIAEGRLFHRWVHGSVFPLGLSPDGEGARRALGMWAWLVCWLTDPTRAHKAGEGSYTAEPTRLRAVIFLPGWIHPTSSAWSPQGFSREPSGTWLSLFCTIICTCWAMPFVCLFLITIMFPFMGLVDIWKDFFQGE